MQACSETVHSVWVFNRRAVIFEQSPAITTMTTKFGFNCMNVSWIGNIQSNLCSNFTANLV